MSRAKVDGKKLDRAAAGGIAEWWTDYALDWHRAHGQGESDAQLGEKLAKPASPPRPAPWSHPTIGRFFRKDAERRATAEIADALMKLYPDLPPYAVEPGDLQEALELAAVHRRAMVRRGETHPGGRSARDILLDRAGVQAGVGASPEKNDGARHPRDLLSAHGMATRTTPRDEAVDRSTGQRGMGRRRS